MTGPTRQPAARCGGGYSLAELMIAMGVLAIALPMVATTFLSGALENAKSIETTRGTLVAENALAIVRARVTHADLMAPRRDPLPSPPLPDGFGTGAMTRPEMISTSLVPLVDLEWNPARGTAQSVPGEATYGCVVLAQRVIADANDYRLIAVPFRKFQSSNTFKSVDVKIGDDPDEDDMDMVTKHEVLLADPDGDPPESADIGFLVQRTAMRP